MIRIWPFPNITLEEAGPTDNDFSYQDEYHNKYHVWRVMFWALCLSKVNAGNHVTSNAGAAICAAFLHDLARRGGGTCNNHGAWAWEEKAETYLPHFERFGVTPKQFKWIRRAVRMHCVPFPEYCGYVSGHMDTHEKKYNFAAGHPDPTSILTPDELDSIGEVNTTTVLRDADSLDLFRIPGVDVTFNPKMLLIERSAGHIGFAREMIARTEADITNIKSFADVWKIGQEITGHSVYEEFMPPVTPGETPLQRRLRNTRRYWATGWPERKIVSETLYGKSISDVMPVISRGLLGHLETALNMEPEKMREDIEDTLRGFSLQDKLGGLTEDIAELALMLRPVTYLSPDTYELFKKDGSWKSFWEIWDEKELSSRREKGTIQVPNNPWGQWHFRYTDEPDLVRESHEFRLYGERGRQTVHGVLLPLDTDTGLPLPQSQYSNRMLSDFYGKLRIEWKTSVLDEATFTVNDSHGSVAAFPTTPTYLHNALQILVIWKALQNLGIDQIRPFFHITPKLNLDDAIGMLCKYKYDFLELQIHKAATMDDIARVMDAIPPETTEPKLLNNVS